MNLKKLTLNKETIKSLSNQELGNVQGGLIALSLLDPLVCAAGSAMGICPTKGGCGSVTIAL